MKGVDLKSVQLLGSAYKEKVQPDMEELTENAEEADDGEKANEAQKLGKLNYKVKENLFILKKIYLKSFLICYSWNTTLIQTVLL